MKRHQTEQHFSVMKRQNISKLQTDMFQKFVEKTPRYDIRWCTCTQFQNTSTFISP